jgi:hypothetical protein
MKQLYEVGEVVLLRSRELPEYDGEYVVQKVYAPNEWTIDSTGSQYNGSHTYSYALGFSFEWGKGVCDAWQQTALRKKHEPSQQSFKDLMTTLKSPQKVEWD